MDGLRCLICGMMVNSRNYHVNEHSFLERNSRDQIINCPFCGVGRAYLAESDQLLFEEISNPEAIRVFGNAMKLEVFNAEYYQAAAKLAKSGEIRRMFEDLSRVEFTHAKVHQRLGGFKELPKLHKPDYSKHETDESLLEEAYKRERHAVHFYDRNSSKIDSEVVREVLKALAEVEKEHMEIVN